MEKKIVVSIFCTTYNHEKYIKKTLDGFISQETDFEFEVLIHDDASTDHTQCIIKEYEKKYPDIIKPILQKENQFSKSISINRTFNYPRAQGKYIAFCEGDDYWCDKDKLQKQVQALEKNESCAFCVHDTICINIDGKVINKKFPGYPLAQGVMSSEKYMEIELVKKPWLFHVSSFLVRKDVYARYLSDDVKYKNAFPAGDKAMTLFLLLNGNCCYIQKEMSCYRVDSGGMMSRLNRDLQFAIRFYEGFVLGYNQFNTYSMYKYQEMVSYRKKSTEIQLLRLKGEYRKILTKEYRDIIKKLKLKNKLLIYVGYVYPKAVYKLFLKVKGYHNS